MRNPASQPTAPSLYALSASLAFLALAPLSFVCLGFSFRSR